MHFGALFSSSVTCSYLPSHKERELQSPESKRGERERGKEERGGNKIEVPLIAAQIGRASCRERV